MITLIIIIFISISVNITKVEDKPKSIDIIKTYSIKDEMNKSIIDGFYDNDTTGIGNKIYLLK